MDENGWVRAKKYPSDTSREQFEIIKPLLERARTMRSGPVWLNSFPRFMSGLGERVVTGIDLECYRKRATEEVRVTVAA